MESGELRVEGGRWKVESGKWRIERGELRVKSGEWRVETKNTPYFVPKYDKKNPYSVTNYR